MKKLKYYINIFQIITILIVLISTFFLFLSRLKLIKLLNEHRNDSIILNNFVQGYDNLSYLEEKEIDKHLKENNIQFKNILILKQKIEKFEVINNLISIIAIYIVICLSFILLLLHKKNL